MLIPRKSLGQNFLHDENIIRKIVETIGPEPGETLLEIGPGTGALTKPLIERLGRLTVVEVDKRAVALLRETFDNRLTILAKSVLDVDLTELAASSGGPLRVAGNIPYNLTSEILFWLIDQRHAVTDATLMVQWEVAQRLMAAPRTKAYGILSIFIPYYTDCRLAFKVSRNCFFPKPDVDSAIIQLRMRGELPEIDDRLFRTVVRSTFGKRRKTLRNGLKAAGWTDDILDRLASDLSRRPEELERMDFVALTRELEKFPS